MSRALDPLRDPKPLIDRVYAYVAYHVGGGAEAEDIVSDVFERAVRYRDSYNGDRGDPIGWLIGIARRCIGDAARARVFKSAPGDADAAGGGEDETSTIERLAVEAAIRSLDDRQRELIALRYGADLTTRQIGALLDMRPNAVDVALHRVRTQLKAELDPADPSTDEMPAARARDR